MSLKFVQTNTLYQAGAGNIIGATTIVLTSLVDIYGNVLTMTDFGAKGYGTLEPDTTNEEAFTFTGIVANANGTYSLTGVSTALAKSPYTESSGTVRAHSGGTKVVITDNVAFWNTFANTSNQNTFADIQTFSVPAVQATDPTSSSQVANKHYVDTTAVSGAPLASTTVKGIVQEATQAQVLAKTASGSTGAELYVNPATLPDTLLSDYKADTGAADASVITPAPAITAYVTGQRFSFKVAATNATTTPTLAVNGLVAKTITKLGGSALVAGDLITGQIVEVEYDGTNFQLMSPAATASITTANLKFGGTGADGALAVSSGNTNIDCGNAAILVKNYTSISITGTGSITFINPHTNGTLVVLKSQGSVTLTSSAAPMIDASGMGAAGGAGAVSASASVGGNIGSTGNPFMLFKTNAGTGGLSTGPTACSGGALTTAIAPASFLSSAYQSVLKYGAQFWVGAGGGSGGSQNASHSGTTGAGGRGGGALIIECGGALNFTTSSGISVAGKVGGTPTDTTYGGAGGGGGAGVCLILYTALTSAAGTITVSGGLGGPNGSNSGSTGGGGGAAAYNAGLNGSTGTGTNAGTGGAGASLIAKNTDFT